MNDGTSTSSSSPLRAAGASAAGAEAPDPFSAPGAAGAGEAAVAPDGVGVEGRSTDARSTAGDWGTVGAADTAGVGPPTFAVPLPEPPGRWTCPAWAATVEDPDDGVEARAWGS
ncbi:MAG TPA: hypothetical protein VNP37_12790, partial [Actinomycetospora sp.]|nr:hypothetical protein [Actinomycetospora sp.]